MKKRLLGILLAVALVASLGIIGASAADGSDEQTETSVALVNGKHYNSLADAVKAIDEEGTITLVADATIDVFVTVSAGKSITLDLGSYTIKPSAKCVSGKVLVNNGELTIIGSESGTIDVSSKEATWCAIENRGKLTIHSGNIIGNLFAVRSFLPSSTTYIDGGRIEAKLPKSGCALETYTETVISGNAEIIGTSAALRAYGAKVTIRDNVELTGQFGVTLFNSTSDNTDEAVHSELTMTGGTITSTGGFALSGNNLQSAGCSANITGGTLKSVDETGIYWPMEGKLTIGGNAVVEGATGIQARMGEIEISGNAVIRGTGAYNDNAPESGIAAADGSALIITSQMYGGSNGQCIGSPDIKVSIIGGTLESNQGNAVTVYNTESTTAQKTNVDVTGGTLEAADGKAAVQVTTAGNSSTSELDKINGTNVLTTSASQTTVTVSADVAAAAVGQNGKTYYYTDVNDVNTTGADAVYIIDEKAKLPDMPSITVTVTADRANALVGSTVTLTATVTSSEEIENLTYQWYMNGQPIDDATEKTLKITDNGVYEVFVTASLKADNTTYYPSASASITYTFSDPVVPDPHAITINQPANGTVSTSLSNASKGAVITVTAKPNAGYELAYITVNGEKITGNTFVMPDEAVTVSAVFVTSSFPFVDVSTGAWYYDAVNYVYTNGLMDGVSDTTFNPDGNMTRAMVWAILARLDGQTVTGANWATMARNWAVREGVSDGENANGLVTREQLATMIWRYVGEPKSTYSLAAYSDANSVSDWASTAMAWAVENGIITGVTSTTLVPQGTASRAQCAAILMRCVEL